MTVGAKRWILSAAAALAVAAVALVLILWKAEPPIAGPTVGEKLAALRTERAGLEARAGGEVRIVLLPSFRIAAQLGDALAVRREADRENAFDDLSAPHQAAFADLAVLHQALKDALSRPGAGAMLAARAATERAVAALERLAGTDDLPLVLQFTPRFVAPRRAAGELPLPPSIPDLARADGSVRLAPGAGKMHAPAQPTVPRYVPPFATSGEKDPPVGIEVVGLHLATAGGPRPVLTVGAWRGEAVVTPERLHFTVPRSAFITESTRAGFVAGTLVVRQGPRSLRFELLFVVLPDRPGYFALDQKIHETEVESKTLLSPEILARGGVGEPRTVRRCFDPPDGWRFDKARRRILVVERLGWANDIPDATVNAGSVEFASDEGPEEICIVVTARPAAKTARAATIGRFEVTLVREQAEVGVVRSGVRALDWREAVRVPMEPNAEAWKLYLRLFDEIDREFSGSLPADLPFLRVRIEDDGRTMVLEADPTAEP